MSHVPHIPRMERGDDWECPIGVIPPKLPAYLDGAIEPFEFNEDTCTGHFGFSKYSVSCKPSMKKLVVVVPPGSSTIK